MTPTTVVGSPEWEPSDTIAVAALVVAVLVPLITLALTGRQQRKSREDDRRDQRRREAALVLGPVLGLLDDCEPDRLAFNAREGETQERIRELRGRWETSIRPGLLAIRAGFPVAAERNLAAELSVAVDNSITSTAWLALDVLRGADLHESQDFARQHHKNAKKLAEALGEEIRR